jgi:cobalt ECF transporter T component CbiQ
VNFIEKTLAGLSGAMDHAATAEAVAGGGGWLQRLDPRAKLCGLLPLIFAAAVSRRLVVTLAIFAFALMLALSSRVPLALLAKRVWLGVFLFTGAIVTPALFLTPGPVLWRWPGLGWTLTSTGLTAAARLVARAETAATLGVLLVLCTPWPRLLQALRVLRLPVVLVAVLGMTHRYIHLFCRTALDMFEARRSRLLARLRGRERRLLYASSAGVLIGKSLQLGEEVHQAMRSRGFRAEFRLMDEFAMHGRDWLALGLLLAAAAAAFRLG